VVAAWDAHLFCGLYTHGVLATTATGVALVRPGLAQLAEPGTPPLAVSNQAPAGAAGPTELTAPATQLAQLLATAGHTVREATPSCGSGLASAAAVRWFAGPSEHAEEFGSGRLQ
jgi:hypothetical protein